MFLRLGRDVELLFVQNTDGLIEDSTTAMCRVITFSAANDDLTEPLSSAWSMYLQSTTGAPAPEFHSH